MSAHTQGPWEADVEADAEPYETIGIVTYSNKDHPEGVLLASVWRTGDEQGAANARLIAAAPDLLEALRGAIAWEEGTRARLGLPQIDAPDWAQAAFAAITKAEGSR